jgi:hypothetical protein
VFERLRAVFLRGAERRDTGLRRAVLVRFRAGACRLAFSAAFWRLVPKCLICFALILRRLLAIFFPLLAGF